GQRSGAGRWRCAVSGNSSRGQRCSGAAGALGDNSVPSGTGSPRLWRGALVGTGGYLYVASTNNWKVARVDPTTGAFLGDFVAAGSGGLTGPNFMLFRPPATPAVPVLEIAPAGGNVALSWPTAAVGWTLQMAPALDAITTW